MFKNQLIFIILYRVTRKGGDCKDDLKLFISDNFKIKLSLTVAGNHSFKETGSINSVQSSLNSHPLWVTLYIYNYITGADDGGVYVFLISSHCLLKQNNVKYKN